ncbi:MAG TPA: Ig-like domain-containing protein [Gemmatimonadaceae bacterium]|nr:Ig-like domain-containing protein [Gemmatimonadaceae bacterium]
MKRNHGWHRLRVAALAVTAILIGSCKDPMVIAGPLFSISVAPDTARLTAGATRQFTAVGKDANGFNVPLTLVWAVTSGGGSISDTGLFTAGPAGTFTVTATSGTISGKATVIVQAGTLAVIAVTPNPASIAANTKRQFTAFGKDVGGNVVDITPVWSVAAGGGTISLTGLFTAGPATGTFSNSVIATSGGKSGTATVTITATAGPLAAIVVTPNPDTVAIGKMAQFFAVGQDAAGNTVPISPVWTVAAGGGTIDTTGLFTAGATPGTFVRTVTATSGTISGMATVVVQAPLVAITVTPNPASIAPNTTRQFTAVGKDAMGNVVVITPVWSIAAGGGTISPTGLFTAGATTGTFTNTVIATSGAISGTATVIVTP